MAKLSVKQGSTSLTVNIFIQDSSSTTGAGLTGLVFNSGSLTAYYMRPQVAATVITLVTLAAITTGYTSGGFKEIDATNAPGWYRLDIPDAVIANSEKFVSVHLKGATNMAPCPLEIELTGCNNQDSVHFGLTALPNVASGGDGALALMGASQILPLKQLNIVNATGDALIASGNGSNGNGINASGNGTGTGIKATGGATGPGAKIVGGATSGDGVDISTTSGDGISILPTAGNAIVGTANGTSKHGAVLTGGTAGTSDGLKAVAGTGGVDFRANHTGNITGNLSGSVGSVTGAVGSVTGAVGSVTGNVGGNVVGSVASVTARVTANSDQIAGVAVVLDANNLLKVDVEDWKGAAAPANTGDAYARLGAPVGASISADIAGVPVASLAATVETNGLGITRTVKDSLKLCLAGFGGTRSGFGTAAPAIADTASLGKVRILGAAADGVGNVTVTIDPTGG